MKDIQMVDLRSQYLRIKEEIDSAIQEVIDSSAFVKGEKVAVFQQNLEKYLGVKHVVPVGNGTDALQIALMALGLKPGDEVITPTFTFIATVEVVALLGLTPILVDVDPNTFCLSIDAVKKAIGPNTKAIIPVHLFGQNAAMQELLQIAKENKLYVIEDACQSIGSKYTFDDTISLMSGCMGDIGCTSFFPSKNLGCYGDGGAIFTDNDDLAIKMRSIANHGMEVRYHHDRIGVNSRLDSIQAAVLDVKLKHLDNYNQARQRVADYYNAAFSVLDNLITPVRDMKSTHVYHQYTLKLEDVNRDSLQAYLKEKGIPSMVYYPIPLHRQLAFEKYYSSDKKYPVADKLAQTVLSLPIHTEMKLEQMEYICYEIQEFINH